MALEERLWSSSKHRHGSCPGSRSGFLGVAKSYPPSEAELLALVEGGGTDRVARHGKAQDDSQGQLAALLLGDDLHEAQCED